MHRKWNLSFPHYPADEEIHPTYLPYTEMDNRLLLLSRFLLKEITISLPKTTEKHCNNQRGLVRPAIRRHSNNLPIVTIEISTRQFYLDSIGIP